MVVQNMLGHRSATMTQEVYSDLFEQDIEEVAERIYMARDMALSPASRVAISG